MDAEERFIWLLEKPELTPAEWRELQSLSARLDRDGTLLAEAQEAITALVAMPCRANGAAPNA